GEYFFRFLSFHSVVNRFKNMNVNPKTPGSSVLSLSLSGTNKTKLVDYLNTCVEVLSEDQLERKNLFATRTIEFIDKNLQDKADELKQIEEQLKEFRQKNPTYIDTENASINERLTALEIQKRAVEQKVDYYNTLESYLKADKNDYSGVQAPSVVGIEEANIVQNVAKILELSERRKRFEYSAREGTLILKEVDRDIQSVKDVLFENIITSRQLLNKEINRINSEMYRVNQQFVSLPQEQQDLLNIQRRYDINERLYNNFLAKRSEAGIVKAANVSDIMVIDEAKDTGGGRIGPQTQINYIIALMFGFFVPFTVLFLITFFDTKIDNPQMLERITSIPLIAVISKYSRAKNNLVVYEHPQEPISEAFRGLRSSLYFNFRKQKIEGAKTILVTSTIPGEGKTFTSINVATVLAMGNKKTLLVGFDMRKPKIFDDFGLDNSVGVVDYLVDKKPLDEVIRKTSIPNLDLITSGMVPRNPSELLMSESLEEFMEEIKREYEFIVFDTPPVTLVTDASELFRFTDVSLYVVRQAYTPKGMLQHINEQYQKGQTGVIFTLFNYYKKSRRYGYGYGYGYNYSYGYGQTKSKTTKNIFKRLKKAFKLWKA
ncbi:MAG: polysaccharide biosynthesis tyrosine autokinase, partial [Flavobacteriaceae bacterium]|nr:polysaccharide biosynthesis tyrosine autokinase [Flavobacteriaceae bacterium]